MAKKLETIQEVLHALANGYEVKDVRGYDIAIVDDAVIFLDTGELYTFNDSVLPCTIVEEPEYLYEWEYVQKLDFYSWAQQSIICKERPTTEATKTGRKFILKDDVPVLVEE